MATLFHSMCQEPASVTTTERGPSSINSAGTIAGTYFDNNGVSHGFVRYSNGSIVPFDAPGAAAAGGGTNVFVMNDSGAIAGYWGDANGNAHGFVME